MLNYEESVPKMHLTTSLNFSKSLGIIHQNQSMRPPTKCGQWAGVTALAFILTNGVGYVGTASRFSDQVLQHAFGYGMGFESQRAKGVARFVAEVLISPGVRSNERSPCQHS